MCFDIKVETVGPNEALIISGVFHGNEPTLIVGGRALVFPLIQTIQKLPLSTMTLVVQSPTVYTSQGVPISVTGIAQVKINGQNHEMLRAAAEQFGGKDESEIAQVAKETLEGHQRAIMGTMSVEEIYRDRKKFSSGVFKVASNDLINMGIMVISYTIKEITDDVGYLKALGMASADLAYSLQAALMTQQIKEQETQVKVIERRQEIELQEQEIFRKEKELESKVEKPAEAEKFKLEKIAEAHRQKAVLEAEAEAEAIALKGDAKAFAIEAKAKAEAEQMAKKADAWNEYGKAALMDMMLKMMPKVASEIADPLSKAKKITMISDNDSDIGASKLTNEVLSIMGAIPNTITKMTGVDIAKQMSERRN